MRTMLLMLIPLCILMFFYVIWRFFVIFGNNSKLVPIIIAIIISAFVLVCFMYRGENKILDILSTISSRIFVLGFLLLVILAICHAISYVRHPVNPWIILGVIAIILSTGLYLSLHTKITNLNIETYKIQKDVKVLLVSDIHVENITQDFHVKKIVKTIEKEKPDFVIIAGDLMNKPNTTYLKYFSAFKEIKDIPVFAVKGNHDVMGNGTIVNDIPKNSEIMFLNNAASKNDSLNIQIVGLIDKSVRQNKTLDEMINQVEFDNNKDWFTILITHQPIGLEKLKDYPIDLEVAGHTHRGQFYGIMEISRLVNEYFYGEYKLGDRIAFVTQGIGTRGLPFRLGTQSEMVIINLIKK